MDTGSKLSSLGLVCSDDSAESHPEDFVVTNRGRRLTTEALRETISCLPGVERRAIVMRFGLDDEQLQTLEHIGDELGLTREGVRRMILGRQESLHRRLSKAGSRPAISGELPAVRTAQYPSLLLHKSRK